MEMIKRYRSLGNEHENKLKTLKIYEGALRMKIALEFNRGTPDAIHFFRKKY